MFRAIQLALLFALLSMGVFCLRLAWVIPRDIRAVSVAAQRTMVVTQETLKKSQSDIDNLQVMTNATLYSISDASHELADMARVEKRAQSQQLARVNAIMDQTNEILAHLDHSQQSIVTDVHNSLAPIAPLLLSTQSTIVKTGGVADQIQSDLVLLQPTITNGNEISGNLAKTTKRIDDAVAKQLEPKPWWKKIGVYSEAAAKLVVTFF